MKMFQTIDLGEYFGAEVRVIDGEECLFIPLRFNPSIRFFGGHPTLLLNLVELRKPDEDGFTHLVVPHIPKSMVNVIPEADYIKMTMPIGRAKGHGRPKMKEEDIPPEDPREEPPSKIDYNSLAKRPVTDDDIPL